MINKDRVRTMTRLAIYEEGQGIADDKMNGFTLKMIILWAIW